MILQETYAEYRRGHEHNSDDYCVFLSNFAVWSYHILCKAVCIMYSRNAASQLMWNLEWCCTANTTRYKVPDTKTLQMESVRSKQSPGELSSYPTVEKRAQLTLEIVSMACLSWTGFPWSSSVSGSVRCVKINPWSSSDPLSSTVLTEVWILVFLIQAILTWGLWNWPTPTDMNPDPILVWLINSVNL